MVNSRDVPRIWRYSNLYIQRESSCLYNLVDWENPDQASKHDQEPVARLRTGQGVRQAADQQRHVAAGRPGAQRIGAAAAVRHQPDDREPRPEGAGRRRPGDPRAGLRHASWLSCTGSPPRWPARHPRGDRRARPSSRHAGAAVEPAKADAALAQVFRCAPAPACSTPCCSISRTACRSSWKTATSTRPRRPATWAPNFNATTPTSYLLEHAPLTEASYSIEACLPSRRKRGNWTSSAASPAW